jgi:predicted RNase H-like HicB family nuclease
MSPVPVYQVVIHPNEDDVPGYWAEYHTEKGGAFTDGDTVKETQANMYESMSLFLQDDYPDITDFSLEFIMGEPVTSNG